MLTYLCQIYFKIWMWIGPTASYSFLKFRLRKNGALVYAYIGMLCLIFFFSTPTQAQLNFINWANIQIMGFSQEITLPTGQKATISYDPRYNVAYRTGFNRDFFRMGPKTDRCLGHSNSVGANIPGLLLADDYNFSHPNSSGSYDAVIGKDWVLTLDFPISNVRFNIYDLTSPIHSASAPHRHRGIYNDQIIVYGKDHLGQTIYPKLTAIGSVFIEGLNDIVDKCAKLNGQYTYNGDIDKTRMVVDNNSTPPTAYTVGGSLNSTTGEDSDCYIGGFAYGMDVHVNFGDLNVTEVVVNYKNFGNDLLGASDDEVITENPDCQLIYTPLQPQGIFIGNMVYEQSSTLPVEFLDFFAEELPTGYELFWSTGQENNNKGFVVEMSYGDQYFKEIGFVPSNSDHDYQFNYPKSKNSTICFRLKQLDEQGGHSYSKVLTMTSKNLNKNEILIYPNPTRASIQIHSEDNLKNLKIYNQMGNLVLDQSQSIDFVNLDFLPSGIYSVLLINKDDIKTYKKLIKY